MVFRLIVFKIGGSVITHKDRYRSFNDVVCRKIVSVISDFGPEVIVTHGAGSFGHILAKKYGLPGKVSENNISGVSEIHADVLRLNLLVSDLLIEHGMNPIQIPPAIQSTGSHMQISQFRRYLEEGFTPVSFGDITVRQGFAYILSADDIVLGLAKAFRPEKVVFFSDVDGIFDQDPKSSKKAHLVKSLGERIKFSRVANDVTGGMKEKVRKIRLIRKYSKEVCVLNGNYPERLRDLGKDSFVGTVV